ncbi:MAG TPA: flavodoxin family protein [Proteobacteria bacterium]|nr:flavodoxin family protein [Pseudomonadota bacterium]
MKKILVLYYSQSGQLEEIMRHLAAPPTSGQDAQM